MAKIQPTANSRKLSAVGFSYCADSLAPSHPQLAAIVSDPKQLDQLELLLKAHGTFRLIEKLEHLVMNKVFPPNAFDDIQTMGVPTGREKKTDALLAKMNPVGTAEWLFEVFPGVKADFCLLLVEAREMEETIRELTANYNYIGLDAEDIPEFLNRSNDFCKILRSLATVQEKRERSLAQVESTRLTRQLMPDETQPAA
jgi:hypothetical protein